MWVLYYNPSFGACYVDRPTVSKTLAGFVVVYTSRYQWRCLQAGAYLQGINFYSRRLRSIMGIPLPFISADDAVFMLKEVEFVVNYDTYCRRVRSSLPFKDIEK